MIATIPVPIIPITIPNVPFYSQLTDITSPVWKKIGCGVASLTMIIDYYKEDVVSVNTVLSQALAVGAYDKNFGWMHKGLISVSNKYGLDGKSYDVKSLSEKAAFASLKSHLEAGPVIVSIHYKFNPKSTIPHLIVVDGIEDGILYYNDPASKSGRTSISTQDFLKGWKKKFIVVRPIVNSKNLTLTTKEKNIL